MRERLDAIRDELLHVKYANEDLVIDELVAEYGPTAELRMRIEREAESLVRQIRSSSKTALLDAILSEYGLDSNEGIALLRISEALIRVPDANTTDLLIEDKIVPADWGSHRGKSPSSLVNLITLLLQMTAYSLKGTNNAGDPSLFRQVLKRAGIPIARIGVRRATQIIASRFVLGKDMDEALRNSKTAENAGFHYSYDMLGEAALTEKDALFFFEAYKSSIESLVPRCTSPDFRDNHGISIKLSALHPRYEWTQRDRVLTELTERVSTLARMARDANMGMNIDAEEADRLELSLDVIEAVLRDPELAGWDGFGVVVQAYGKAASHVIDWLYELARSLDRKIMIRLVKGAYWDTEIKRAQVEGLQDFPVFTRKSATDVSYICCARKLMSMSDRIYAQFASHNAHTVSSILTLVDENQTFEFQCIHGMGSALHSIIHSRGRARCRIYAPVGQHRELLPYLARRMLENGANSSFVNQIASTQYEASEIAMDPFHTLQRARVSGSRRIAQPVDLFGSERRNSRGWDLHNPAVLDEIKAAREPLRNKDWSSGPASHDPEAKTIINPADPADIVGRVAVATTEDVETALDSARSWNDVSASRRAAILIKASDLFERNAAGIFSLLCREAGKTLQDATAELREAVDFLRYYATEAETAAKIEPVGLVVCISPWNFPLAIFTGQIAGALAAGNGVLAKPAGQTPLMARLAVDCLHDAGVPKKVLQLLPGSGSVVGNRLVSDPRVGAVGFTGSTETAAAINHNMATRLKPSSRLIAETGGQNAMIVDSTALPEQVVKAIIASSFQSAGQRCSALRMLYLQEDIADSFLEMLFGAMDFLRLGDPWHESTDVGPLVDREAMTHIQAHVDRARSEGRLLKQCPAPDSGWFVGPAVIEVSGIGDLEEEIFGPVLHVATFASTELDAILEAINNCGYGLTFGLHTRIDSRIEDVVSRLRIGNMYVNRNQIGAVVGSQPFGGEGLSGTGPKAGGPDYIWGYARKTPVMRAGDGDPEIADVVAVQNLLDTIKTDPRRRYRMVKMPGPTGESNQLHYYGRGTVLCLGPRAIDADRQAEDAHVAGCSAVRVASGVTGELAVPGKLSRASLASLRHFDVVALWSDDEDLRAARTALASRKGPLIPLVSTGDVAEQCLVDRHVCIDTTAAGGNASLFAEFGRY